MSEIKEAILRIEKEMKALDGSVDKNLWMIQGLSKAWNICLDVERESETKQETYEEWKLKNPNYSVKPISDNEMDMISARIYNEEQKKK